MKLTSIATCASLAVLLAGGSVFGQYRSGVYRKPGAARVAQTPARSGSILNSLFRLQQRADDEEDALENAAEVESPAPLTTEPDALEGAVRDAVNRERIQTPPADQESVRIPIRNPDVNVTHESGLVSVVVRNASLKDVVAMIGETMRLNVVCADTVTGSLSMSLERVPLEQALTAITSANGATWNLHEGIIYVTPLSGGSELAPEVQGRIFQVFELDFVDAQDMSTIIAGLLSPVGQSFTVLSASDNNRKAREAIVVEDVAPSVRRIASRIAQLDVAPRQVQIEAHVLEVELGDNMRHGVNFDHAFSMMGSSFKMSTTGFASPTAQQAFFAEITGPHLNGLIEWLQTTTDAKTLASPSLTVLNKQSARIQVGEQLGFRVTTTTDTSTTEGVETLDVGVLLEVTPQISRDHRVLLKVRPEISSGQVNPNTGLPEEEVTELQTDVMLENGKGIIIGGLIQEKDELNQSKVPWFGDLEHIGKLFGLQNETRARSEIIIALIPRIVPVSPERQMMDDMRYHRTTSPVIEGPLWRAHRPWEPRLPDPVYNPIPLESLHPHCLHRNSGHCDECAEEAGQPLSPTPGQGLAPPSHQTPPAVHVGRAPTYSRPPIRPLGAPPSSSRRQARYGSGPNSQTTANRNNHLGGAPRGYGQPPGMQRFPPVMTEQPPQQYLIGRSPYPSIR